jgi:endonuclease/exonuclease/phosphatase (EEP) superfamily protein YafD
VVNTVKPILVRRYQLANGQMLTLANIHAINFVDWKVFARQVTKGLKYLDKFAGPIVFGGDFNSWNQAKLDFLKSEMLRYGFSQVKLRHPERVKKVFDFPIDHIFVRDVDVVDADYLEHKTSDHTPMMLTLKF